MADIEHPLGREGYRFGLARLAESIGYPNGATERLQTAFTHRSYANEVVPRQSHNERLEFLGDAVLDLVVAEALMEKFPLAPEGELHRLRTTLVCTESLAKRARELELGQLLRLGKGELKGQGRQKDSLLANAFEAMLGALYLDQGYERSRIETLKLLTESLGHTSVGDNQGFDPKSRLQELTQKVYGTPPLYRLISTKGPEHEKEFLIEVLMNGVRLGAGCGRSKKSAERAAAREAIVKLESEES
jgi:ribonuclease III